MNKQEVISKLKSAIPKNNIDDYQRGEAAGLNFALLLLAELDEPVRPPEPKLLEIEKPVVPQFVADWYEERKDYFDFNIYGFYKYFYSQGKHEEVKKWLDNAENKAIETLVKMKLYGYEVEKGKLYTVEIPICNSPLGYHYVLRKTTSGEIIIDSFFTDNWGNYDYCQLTEAEIKKDFAWAWKYAEEVEE